jgi:hypothetical protein
MVSDELYVRNKTNDSKKHVLIGHLLHQTNMKVSWLLHYIKNIGWMIMVGFYHLYFFEKI